MDNIVSQNIKGIEHRLRTKIGIAENQFGFMARRSTIEFIYLL